MDINKLELFEGCIAYDNDGNIEIVKDKMKKAFCEFENLPCEFAKYLFTYIDNFLKGKYEYLKFKVEFNVMTITIFITHHMIFLSQLYSISSQNECFNILYKCKYFIFDLLQYCFFDCYNLLQNIDAMTFYKKDKRLLEDKSHCKNEFVVYKQDNGLYFGKIVNSISYKNQYFIKRISDEFNQKYNDNISWYFIYLKTSCYDKVENFDEESKEYDLILKRADFECVLNVNKKDELLKLINLACKLM